MKTVLTISRKWHSPQIETTITQDSISLAIDIDDFLEAVSQEIGTVTWVFTEKSFRAKFDDAVSKVLAGIKEESAKVV